MTADATTHKHPNYIAVWGALAALTAVEVAIVYFRLERKLLIPLLIFLALWKAMLVALYFMHLKFEPRRLLAVVLAPLPLAVILVMLVLREF